MNKIAIFEPNPYHSEVLPGIVKYFEDLNFCADVYLRKEAVELNVFAFYNIVGKIIPYVPEDIPKIFSDENMRSYEFCFFSSMEHNENKRIERFLNELDSLPATKHGVLGMYHTNCLIEQFDDWELLRLGRLFCIADFQSTREFPLKVLAPFYFGNFVFDKVHKNETKRLLIVGNSWDVGILNCSYFKLSKSERKKLEIVKVGELPSQHNCRKILSLVVKVVKEMFSIFCRKYKMAPVVYKGKLGFIDLYKEIEKSDFLLFTIDLVKTHSHFIKTSVSGARQLCMGFTKPMICPEIVGKKYFSNGACIFYQEGKLYSALKKVISINGGEYNEVCQKLKQYSNAMYKQCLENLKKTIEETRKENDCY